MRRPFLIAALALAALECGWAGGAAAQPIDLSHGGPIDVTSQDGMEWRQNEQVVIARGDARAVRGDVTVMADELIAHYRKKAAAGAAPASADSAAPPPSPRPGSPDGSGTGQNEIYRLEATGHVKIFTRSDIAVADHAVYDIDQAVLVLTGQGMSVTTPNQVMTARDVMEYWSQKHMAVGRGDATVVTSDGRRVSADVLVGYTRPDDQPAARATSSAPPVAGGKAGGAPVSAGKLQRVEAFGNVVVRTATETVRGDRGVYVADTDIARLLGHVRITRGQNQLEGDEALVNMKTGISTLVRDPGRRVEGLVIPNDTGMGGKDAKPGTAKGDAPSTPTRKP